MSATRDEAMKPRTSQNLLAVANSLGVVALAFISWNELLFTIKKLPAHISNRKLSN